jgi:hypothetical protein
VGRLIIVPVVALALAWLAVLGTAMLGEHPLWGLTPRNLAEAAAFRDGAAIVRGVSGGDDPAVAGEVRAGFLSSAAVTVTPLEAAAGGSREEIVRLLVALGVRPDAGAWTRAWCSTKAEGVRAELMPARPVGATTECP